MSQALTVKRKIRKGWTQDILSCHPTMRTLLQKSNADEDKLICSRCVEGRNPYNTFKKDNIIAHFTSDKHLKCFKDEDLNKIILAKLDELKYEDPANRVHNNDDTDKLVIEEPRHPKDSNDDAKKLKFMLTKFIIDHKLPYSISSPLVELLQKTIQNFNQETILNCSLSRTTCSTIIRNCISPSLKEEIINDLVSTPYSISTDESTDIHGTSFLAVCATYLPHVIIEEKPVFKEPVTRLVSVIELEDDHTGKALYSHLKENFFSLHKDLETKFIGIATDEGPNMHGPDKGLASRLCAEYEYGVACSDLSHQFNNICKQALPMIPSEILDIVKDTSSYFSFSSLRRAKLRKVQRKMKRNSVLEVLTYTPLRWLSLSECTTRIIELWDPLRQYFIKYGDELQKKSFSPENRLALTLVMILLSKLTYYNREFQSTHMYYDKIHKNLQESYIIFCQLVLKEEFRYQSFETLFSLEWDTDADSLLSIEEFALNFISDYTSVKALLAELDRAQVEKVFEYTKKFVIRVLTEMQRKFTHQNKIIQESRAVFLRTGKH